MFVRAQNNGGLKRLYGTDTASCYAHHETGRDISQIIDSITCMRYVEYREGFPLWMVLEFVSLLFPALMFRVCAEFTARFIIAVIPYEQVSSMVFLLWLGTCFVRNVQLKRFNWRRYLFLHYFGCELIIIFYLSGINRTCFVLYLKGKRIIKYRHF